MYTLPCTIFIRERSCDVCYPIRIENYCLRVKMAAPCEPVDASTSSALPKLLRCVFMHVTSMKFENFTAMTNLRQTKPILCAKEWIKLSGGDREIADQNEVIQLLRGTDCNLRSRIIYRLVYVRTVESQQSTLQCSLTHNVNDHDDYKYNCTTFNSYVMNVACVCYNGR